MQERLSTLPKNSSNPQNDEEEPDSSHRPIRKSVSSLTARLSKVFSFSNKLKKKRSSKPSDQTDDSEREEKNHVRETNDTGNRRSVVSITEPTVPSQPQSVRNSTVPQMPHGQETRLSHASVNAHQSSESTQSDTDTGGDTSSDSSLKNTSPNEPSPRVNGSQKNSSSVDSSIDSIQQESYDSIQLVNSDEGIANTPRVDAEDTGKPGASSYSQSDTKGLRSDSPSSDRHPPVSEHDEILRLERILLEYQVQLQQLHSRVTTDERKLRELRAMVPPPLSVLSYQRNIQQQWIQIHETEVRWTRIKAKQEQLIHRKKVRSMEHELMVAKEVASAAAEHLRIQAREDELLHETMCQLKRMFQNHGKGLETREEAVMSLYRSLTVAPWSKAAYRKPRMPTYRPGMCGSLGDVRKAALLSHGASSDPEESESNGVLRWHRQERCGALPPIFPNVGSFVGNREFYRHLQQYAKEAQTMFEIGMWNPEDAVTVVIDPKHMDSGHDTENSDHLSNSDMDTEMLVASAQGNGTVPLVVTRDFLTDFILGWSRVYCDRIHIVSECEGQPQHQELIPLHDAHNPNISERLGGPYRAMFFLQNRSIMCSFHAIPAFWAFIQRTYDYCASEATKPVEQIHWDTEGPVYMNQANMANRNVLKAVVFRNFDVEDRKALTPKLWATLVLRWEAFLRVHGNT